MHGSHMDDEKLSDAITNLEIARHQMTSLYEQFTLDDESKKSFFYSLQLIRESLDILRNFEIRNEIERFSVSDE